MGNHNHHEHSEEVSCEKCRTLYQTEEQEDKYENIREVLIILVSGILLLTGIFFEKRMHSEGLSLLEYAIYLTAYFLVGTKFLRKAIQNIFKKNFFDENALLAIATIGAILIHEIPEAVLVMLLFRIGEFFQDLSIKKSRRRIRKILELKPNFANLKVKGEIKRVKPEEVKRGDIIVVRPGEKIPLDGVVIKGESLIDTSPITGESVPRLFKEGDNIPAGVINKEGLLEIKVLKEFNESSITRILELVEKARERKANAEKFITKFAKYYTPAVLLIGSFIAFGLPFITDLSFKDSIYRALVLLVIACPCALVISVPLSYFAGIGSSSKKGILIKGSNYLDLLNSVDVFLFDKTGTITKGVFKVKEVVTFNGFSKEELIRIAALSEKHSNHPIAKAIKEYYGKPLNGIEPEEFQEKAGFGVFAKIEGKKIMVGSDRLLHEHGIEHELCKGDGTTVHVVIDNVYAGYLIISDEIREEAREIFKELKKLGIKKTGMLTGDEKFPAENIYKKLNLDFYKAELLPEEKVKEIEKLRNQNTVAFVGDGINDAAAIATSDVGIAMGAMGQDAAIESSDIVIMDDNLSKLVSAIKIAKKTRKVVWQNIIFAIGVKLIFLILGSLGVATMWEAVFADMGVSLIAIFNAMRIMRV